MRSRSSSARVARGSKWSCSTRQAPAESAANERWQVPNEEKSGTAISMRSPGRRSTARPASIVLRERLRWVSCTPLENDVVPEV